VRQLLFSFIVYMLIVNPVRAEQSRNIELLAASCAACHGTRGNSSNDIPTLAGIDKNKFKQEINAFVSGEREATVMHQHAVGYSDVEMELLADFFSKQ